MEAVLAQPVHRDDQPVGVLVLLWKERFGEIHPRVRSVIALLAREAALAMDQRRMLSQLRELAERDELTRLPNRRAWQDGIRRELLRASASRQPLSVALIDLDHFKRFNDERGHDAGDRCLRDAGAAWRAQLRDGDILARLGGEEFAVMLPGCSEPEGAVVIDELRAATPLGQTCSAGVAQWDGSETSSELLARADRALYQAKAGGRNRTAVAGQPVPRRAPVTGRSNLSSTA